MNLLRAKIVVQNRKTLLYLSGKNEWVGKITDAQHFSSVVDANTHIRKYEIAGVDILMSFGDQRYDVRLRGSD